MSQSISKFGPYIDAIIENYPDINLPQKQSQFVDFMDELQGYFEKLGLEKLDVPISQRSLFVSRLKSAFNSRKENIDEIEPIAALIEKPEEKPIQKPKRKSKGKSIEQLVKEQETVTQKKPPMKKSLKPSIPEKVVVQKEPDFEIPSKEDEYALGVTLIDLYTDTYNFDKGKKIMVRTKGETTKVDRTDALKNKEKDELERAKLEIFEQYENILGKLNEFVDENLNDGTLKVGKEKIEITFTKESKNSPKRDPIVFKDYDLVESFKNNQATLFKFIAKDFLSDDANYMSIIGSGIVKSRSIIKSTLFTNTKGIDKMGILAPLNINICEELPFEKISIPEEGKCDGLDDYYWLILNSKIKQHPSDIFERRFGLIKHPRFEEIDIITLWNEARENIKGNTSEVGKIWNDILNSSFMYKIIVLGYDMNPLVYPCFKKFINCEESMELFRNELYPISFMFTCLNLGPVNKSLEESRKSIWELFDYMNFSFVAKLLSPDVECVVDLQDEPKKKTTNKSNKKQTQTETLKINH